MVTAAAAASKSLGDLLTHELPELFPNIVRYLNPKELDQFHQTSEAPHA